MFIQPSKPPSSISCVVCCVCMYVPQCGARDGWSDATIINRSNLYKITQAFFERYIICVDWSVNDWVMDFLVREQVVGGGDFFAPLFWSHIKEQSGAIKSYIGPASVQINQAPISEVSVHCKCLVGDRKVSFNNITACRAIVRTTNSP